MSHYALNATRAARKEDEGRQRLNRLAGLTMIVIVGRIAEVVPGLSVLPVAKITLGLLAIMVWRMRSELLPIGGLPIARTAFWMFGLTAASIVFSVWKSNSLAFVLDTLLVMVLMFYVLARVLSTWQAVRCGLIALCITAVILAGASLVSYAGGRVETSSTYDPNDLAYVLITILPLLIAFAIVRSGARRWLAIGAAVIVVTAFFLTQSRGGLVALLVSLPLLAGLVYHGLGSGKKPRGQKAKFFLVACAVALLTVAAWPLLPQDARERLSSVFAVESDYNVTSDSGRIAVWKRNLGAAARRPIGYGVGSAPTVDGLHGGTWLTAHNSLVQVLVELGVLGLFLFLRLYWLALRQLRAVIRQGVTHVTAATSDEMVVFARALRVGIVANFAAAFFLSQAYSYLLLCMLALIAGLSVASQPPGGQRPARRAAYGVPQRAGNKAPPGVAAARQKADSGSRRLSATALGSSGSSPYFRSGNRDADS